MGLDKNYKAWLSCQIGIFLCFQHLTFKDQHGLELPTSGQASFFFKSHGKAGIMIGLAESTWDFRIPYDICEL
jgi:hypothetical protein